MINKNCFLTKKGQLYVVLHHKCKYVYISSPSDCLGCPYYLFDLRQPAMTAAEIKREQMNGYIKNVI